MKQNNFPLRFALIISICVLASFAFFSCEENTRNSSQGNTQKGATIFRKNCKLCHGSDGKLGLNGAMDLTKSTLSKIETIKTITEGRNQMQSFRAILSKEEIRAVTEFVIEIRDSL